MLNAYQHRDALKDACGIPASSTGDHDQLDMSLESASRLIDDWLGYHLYAQVATKYFTARDSERLRLEEPVLSVTTLRTDAGGNGSYESTWSTDSYRMRPRNATYDSPPGAYWELTVNQGSTISFPAGVVDGVELLGVWGRYNERTTSTAVISTGMAATGERIEVTGATSLHPGQTIRIDDEIMAVVRNGHSGSGTATTSGSVFVQRAINGSSAATHASGTAIQMYTFPLADRACQFQAQQDFRRGLGEPNVGGMFSERVGVGSFDADLHPAVRRMLRGLRTPVAI